MSSVYQYQHIESAVRGNTFILAKELFICFKSSAKSLALLVPIFLPLSFETDTFKRFNMNWTLMAFFRDKAEESMLDLELGLAQRNPVVASTNICC